MKNAIILITVGLCSRLGRDMKIKIDPWMKKVAPPWFR